MSRRALPTRLRRLRRLRRLPTLGVATVLLIGGGSGLLALAYSSGPAGADNTALGGFTVNALAEAVTAQYEQPNFPLPSTPSLEFDEGYAATSDNFGPSGSAVASVFYPGQVVANAGPELSLLVPGVPLPPAPVWPLEAVSKFPETPNTAATDEPGVSMDASSDTNGNTATASLGDDAATAGASGATASPTAPSGPGNVLAGSSALIGIGNLSGTSSSQAPSTSATASASATVSGISLLAGFITIGAVTTTATATSDGTSGTVTGSTVLTNVDIAGQQVTIDANGISVTGKNTPLALPVAALNTLLKELGITLAVTNATDSIKGPSASRTLDGLQLSINLDTLDAAAGKFESLLPASLTSSLPVALPNMQLLTLDLGTVTVSSTASPAFGSDSGSGDTGTTSPSDQFTSPTTGSFGTTGDTGGSSFSAPGGTTGTPSPTATTPAAGTGSPSGSGQPTSAVTPVFKGVGTLFLLAGLALALILAYAYKRADDLSELVGSNCVDGDPLSSRFDDAGGPIDTGGFGA
jgi:hypothetical protein